MAVSWRWLSLGMTLGETKSTRRARDISVDSLRGLAVLLMVAGHVIGSDVDHGLQVDEGSFWRLSYLALEDIRMPLFTVLSGLVYGYRPLQTIGAFPGMVQGKARRLLVPMATVGAVFFGMQLLVPGTNDKPDLDDFWRIFIYGFAHLWFVQAIFLIFLTVGILDACNVLSTSRGWLIAFSSSCVLYVAVQLSGPVNVFSASGAIRLLPFFLLGYALTRLPSLWAPRSILPLASVVFCMAFAARLVLIVTRTEIPDSLDRLLSLSIGVAAVTVLVLIRDRICLRFLAWIGPFSFGIYLLHVFGAAGARIALSRISIDNDILVFAACMLAAIGLPILAEKCFGRFRLFSWGVLGQKPSRRSANHRAEKRLRVPARQS